MKNDEDQEHKASTSREERFLRAWGRLEHIEDSRLRLSTALRMYETEIIMEDWETTCKVNAFYDDDFALETPRHGLDAEDNPGNRPGLFEIFRP